jgi:hypothetical protein
MLLTGYFVPRDDTVYTVEYYKQNMDGTYPSSASEIEKFR